MIKNKTVAFCTLGCRVNQYETRAVEESFLKEGFSVGKFTQECDVYVINTCTVTGESDRKSRQMIRRAVKNGKGKAVVAVMGCMSQVDAKAAAGIEGVSIVLGNGEKMSCVAKVLSELDKKDRNGITCKADVPDIYCYDKIEKMSVTGSDNTRAFLKVVDGCENKCSYCIIPSARGKIRSKPIDDVVKECKDIISLGGCREIVLTGIETAAYGKDLGTDLVNLAEAVSKVDGVKRIRFGSLEPTVLKEEFVKRLSEIPSFMPHFHLSLQSGSDSVLARMKRKYNTAMFYEKICLLRKYFPQCQITTDIIVGFPGETEEEFQQTVEFAKKCRFLYIHIFPYSDRKGTVASDMNGKWDDKTKQHRVKALEDVMHTTRREILKENIGKTMHILCETDKGGFMHGYTENYIEVRVKNDGFKPNDIVKVKLEAIENDGEFITCTPTED